MIEVGEKCKECKYWSRRSESCDYRLITGCSRTITNNMRLDPKYCDKFVQGRKKNNYKKWNDDWYNVWHLRSKR